MWVSRRRRGSWVVAIVAAASLGVLGVIALTSSATPARPAASGALGNRAVLRTAPGRPAAHGAALSNSSAVQVAQGSQGTLHRFNVGATHSPRLLQQLAGPAGTQGPMITAPLAAATAGPVAGAPQGVDVASYQHPKGAAINWATVAADGIKFAAVKVTEGAYYTNPYALQDLPHAKAAGLTTVAYAFAIPNGGSSGSTHYSSSPVVQADDLINYLTSNNVTVPTVMLDIEYDPYTPGDGTTGVCYGLSKSAMVSWISKFDAEIQTKTGSLPVIYTTADWWSQCTGKSTAFGATPIWPADYSSSGTPLRPAGWTTWNFWQYTSSGTVKGIPGSSSNTDLDALNPALITVLDPGTQQDPGDSAITPVQVSAFTVSPAPSLTYTASGLPPGLAISSTGDITGTPSQIGSYPVTVTASGGSGTTGSVSFTWDVSGSITVNSIADRTTVAGSPVKLQATATDSATTQTPSFTATGLPPGLAISTSGLITGWPDTPGTYHPVVTAADNLGATGKASLTWTVSAAPDQGPAGPVRLDLGGKCLDDNGNGTTNGNKIVIWTCNGSTQQTWTAVKDGTLRIHGKCLDIHHGGTANGTQVDLYTCNGSAAQQWQVGTGAELVNPHSGKCLADPGSSTRNGVQTWIYTCIGKANQKWALPAGPVVSGIPGKCLDDGGNKTVNGNRIDIWACNGAKAENWAAAFDGTLRIHGKCLDVSHGGTTSGTVVDLWTCNGTAAQKWQITASGSGTMLRNPHSGLCLADPGDSTTNGVQAWIVACAADPGVLWRVY